MGVDPNERTSDGKTALEIAQIVRHQGIIKILSQVTSVRPTGRAANYNRRENRAHYKAIADRKKQRLWEKRVKLKEKGK
jgi:ankyrin repeat protein